MCRTNIFLSKLYSVNIPLRRDREKTEVRSKWHRNFVIDKRCFSFTQIHWCNFSVTQQTEGFGCQNKIDFPGTMPQFSVLSLSVIRKSIKFIAAKFSSKSTTLLEKVEHSAVPAAICLSSEVVLVVAHIWTTFCKAGKGWCFTIFKILLLWCGAI